MGLVYSGMKCTCEQGVSCDCKQYAPRTHHWVTSSIVSSSQSHRYKRREVRAHTTCRRSVPLGRALLHNEMLCIEDGASNDQDSIGRERESGGKGRRNEADGGTLEECIILRRQKEYE